MKRAFIAAPLIGTLVFLIAVIFVVYLNNSEQSAVSSAVSAAYHNRLLSMVEIYRTDLGSNFNVGLKRSVEYGLNSQCWLNYGSINTKKKITDYSTDQEGYIDSFSNSPCPNPNNGIIDECEDRFYRCTQMTELIKQVVCSTDSSHSYGLPSWLNITAERTSFEGVVFDKANVAAFQSMIGASPVASNTCRTLVKDVLFDCRNFAVEGSKSAPLNQFRCCKSIPKEPVYDSVSTKTFDLPSDVVCDQLPGCEDGVFFISIDVQNDTIFPNLPRLLSYDSSGNTLRSNAISENSYYAPINYPLFKYLDAAFVFGRYLAFGKNADETEACAGIAQGYCYGGADCSSVHLSSINKPSGCAGSPTGASAIQKETQRHYFNNAVVSACNAIQDPPYALVPQFCTSVYSCNSSSVFDNSGISYDPTKWIGCVDVLGAPNIPDDAKETLLSSISSLPCDTGNNYCGYMAPGNNINLQVRFVDTNPAFQVDPSNLNRFCWISHAGYVEP